MFTPGSTGSTAYLIESNRTIREVTVLRAAADMVTVRLGAGAERVRASRLYGSREDAEAALPSEFKPKVKTSPWDWA